MRYISPENLILNKDNPRKINEAKFKKLVESIKSFPKMLELRPIVVDADLVVLGGNMRLRAALEAGLDTVPYLVAEDLTEEQKKEFIVKDNVSFGEWDWDLLDNSWDIPVLEDWGVDVIQHDWDQLDYIEEEQNLPTSTKDNKIIVLLTDELVPERNDIRGMIKTLLDSNYAGIDVQ